MKKIFAVALLALAPFAAHAKKDTLKVNTTESKVNWEGRKIAGKHNGHLKLKGGSLEMEKGALVGGEFEIDMNSVVVEDITDKESNGKLAGHLKSDDFFSVEKNPVAKFKITKVEGKTVTGDLTIKGITHSISFPVETKTEAKKVSAVAKMEIDRTKWDIKYRSGKFFPSLGDKVIKDEFAVDVHLIATK
jgi:polyisoprenoid-binding protein YceI